MTAMAPKLAFRKLVKGRRPADAIAFLVYPPIFYLVLALAIMGPLLAPGRLLTLDSLIAFNFDIPGYLWGTSDGPKSVFAANYNSAPVALILRILDVVLPISVVEKVWLIFLFWLCGFGASRLPYLHGVGRYYAGLLYTVNPFTYIRFVAGQWGVLGAYALFPFTVSAFVSLLEEPNAKNTAKIVLLLTAIGFMQVHGLMMAVILLALIYVGRVINAPGSWKIALKYFLPGTALYLGLNAFWLVRYLSAGGAVHNMTLGELRYFAAFSPLDVLSLRGFWLSAAYIDIADVITWWWVLALPLLFMAIYGAIAMLELRQLRWLALGLSLLAVASIVFAAGPGLAAFAAPFQWLWERFPWYRAFRDSHKFVGLLALVYAYLGAFGAQAFLNRFTQSSSSATRIVYSMVGVFAFVILVYSFPLFGTWGQLRPTEFPPDWYEVRAVLNADEEDYSVLVLPWHMYLDFSWLPNSSKKLVNPAPSFFSQTTISGDNIEVSANFSDSSNPQSKYLEALLRQGELVQDFGSLIAPLNAKYVILYKDADYESYRFLSQQDDLELVFEGQTIALFRNLNPTARVYAVNDVVYFDSLDQYMNTTSELDPLLQLIVLGPNGDESSFGGLSEVNPVAQPKLVQANAVSFHVDQVDGTYLVITLPQHTVRNNWEHEGSASSLTNLDMAPAFRASPGKNVFSFTRFYKLYLPTYGLAVASLVSMGVIFWRREGTNR